MGEEPNSSILSWANLAWNRCFKCKTWNWKVNIYPGSLTRDTEVPTGESSEVEGSKCGRKKEAGTRWGDWVRGEDAGPILHQKLMLSKLVKRSRREPPPPGTWHVPTAPSPLLPPCFLPPQPPLHQHRAVVIRWRRELWALTPSRVHTECQASNYRRFHQRSRSISPALP